MIEFFDHLLLQLNLISYHNIVHWSFDFTNNNGPKADLPWIWISMDISMDGLVISMDIVDIHGHRGYP